MAEPMADVQAGDERGRVQMTMDMMDVTNEDLLDGLDGQPEPVRRSAS